MVKCKKSVPKALTYKRNLQNDKSYISEMAQTVTFITTKLILVAILTIKTHFFTVGRNVFGHFGHVHFVIWVLAGQDFLQRPSLRYGEIWVLGSPI